MEIIGVIIAGVIVGLLGNIVGLLGKFVAPSTRNNIPLWLTILLTIFCGIGGVIIGWYIYTAFGGNGSPGIDWVRWLIAIAVAGVLVVIANAIVGKSTAKRNEAIVDTATTTPGAEESVGQNKQVKRPQSTPDDEIEDGTPGSPISPEPLKPDAGATHEQRTAELRHRQVEERQAKTESGGGEVGKVLDHKSGGIFLSYRREDAAPYARLLELQLMERFSTTQVFLDLDSIEAGLDFADVIQRALSSSAVLVALIGRQWTTIVDEEGRRRLDNPDDYVRYEIQTALERGLRVIPVLVDGAKPLRRQDLPAQLQDLTRLNALELSYDRYQYDADRLLGIIERVLAAAPSSG